MKGKDERCQEEKERERERETGFLFPRMEARELYSLLSIFETSLASPRRNPLALAPSYAASPSPPPQFSLPIPSRCRFLSGSLRFGFEMSASLSRSIDEKLSLEMVVHTNLIHPLTY